MSAICTSFSEAKQSYLFKANIKKICRFLLNFIPQLHRAKKAPLLKENILTIANLETEESTLSFTSLPWKERFFPLCSTVFGEKRNSPYTIVMKEKTLYTTPYVEHSKKAEKKFVLTQNFYAKNKETYAAMLKELTEKSRDFFVTNSKPNDYYKFLLYFSCTKGNTHRILCRAFNCSVSGVKNSIEPTHKSVRDFFKHTIRNPSLAIPVN